MDYRYVPHAEHTWEYNPMFKKLGQIRCRVKADDIILMYSVVINNMALSIARKKRGT